MEKEILKKIENELKFKDKIIVRLFPNLTLKIYKLGEKYVKELIDELSIKYNKRKGYISFLVKMICKETNSYELKKIEEYLNKLF